MATIESIIKKLVRTHEFVIIPGFGALLSHQVEASFDRTNGTYTPSSRKLSFNEFVSQDDGFFAHCLAQTEGLTHQQALGNIKDFVAEHQEILRRKGETTITGVGTFHANIEGKLMFEPDRQQYIEDDWYGFEAIKVKELETPILGPPVDIADAEYVQDDQDAAKRSLKWYHWASAAMLVAVLAYFSFFMVVDRQLLNRSDLNPFNLIGVASTASTPEASVAEPVIEPVVVEVLAVEAPLDSLTNPEEVLKAEPSDIDLFEYYLIAGAFSSEKQAGIMVEQMQKKGYPMSQIIGADEHSSKYKVAVQGFVDKSSAQAANSQLKEVIGGYGWVYHKR